MEQETTDFFPEATAKLGNSVDPNAGSGVSTDQFARDVEEFPIAGLNANRRNQKSRILNKRAQGVDGAATKTKHEDNKAIVTGYDILNVARPRFDLKNLGELFERDDTNFAAIRVKAANVIGIGYDLVDSNETRRKKDRLSEDPDAKRRLEARVQNAKFDMFGQLDALNEDDDFIDVLEKVYIDYESTGNGFLEVGRTALGRIGYVGHIPSHTMRVRTSRDGFVQMIADKAVFFRNFGDTETVDPIANDERPNEIIHFKKYTPNDLYYGMPDIVPAMNAIAGNSFADAYNLDYFENKAVPRHMVVMKGSKFGSKSQKDILTFFDESLRGKHHRTLLLQLPPDFNDRKSSINIEPIEAGDQEASFNLYHKKNMERILMVHRVPVTMVGVTENVPQAVGASAARNFKELTVRPTQRKVEKKVNYIIREFTNVFKFRLNELTISDEQQQAAIDTAYYNMNALVPNEVRSRWGYPGLPDGDKTMVELNGEAAAQAAKEKEQERQYRATDARQRDRTANANRTDSTGEPRNPQGEGRTAPRS